MSFILDALKKSEAERNRKSGPVLMDMRIARPRRQLPVWVWVIAIVLLANLALLGYVLLRSATHPAPAVAAAPSAGNPAGVPATPPATAVSAAPAGNAAAAPVLPPPALPATTPATAPGVVIRQSNAVVSPDDFPALPATGAPTRLTAPGTPTENDLPSDEDLRQGGVALPNLRLSLHVYDDIPANRFVLLNASRLREGQETAEGVLVERIEPTSVVLAWRGRRFRMRPGN
jgi:general secretion pathway protein B